MSKKVVVLLAALFIGCFFTFQAAAQEEWTRESLQTMYMEYLVSAGYRPEVDVEDVNRIGIDIRFRVSGDSYYIIIDENDLHFFQIYMGFRLDNITMEEALELSNYTNRRSKVAKVSVSPASDDRIIISITTELLVNSPNQFASVFSRALSLIANARNIFSTQLRDLISARN